MFYDIGTSQPFPCNSLAYYFIAQARLCIFYFNILISINIFVCFIELVYIYSFRLPFSFVISAV